MENELDMSIGNRETEILKAAVVKVVEVKIESIVIKTKENKKVVCLCQHPDKKDPIRISGVKFETNGILKQVGLWLDKDEENKIRKGSALATLMEKVGAKTLKEMIGKEINTVLDDKKYLVFKAY